MSKDAPSGDSIYSYLGRAKNYFYLDDEVKKQIYGDSARMILEKKIVTGFPDPLNHLKLGTAYAFLERKEDSRAQTEKAMQMVPVSMDYYLGIRILGEAVFVSIFNGDYEKALDGTEYYLSNPFYYNINLLKLYPIFDPVRDHPRFKALIEKYEKEHGT